VGPDVLPVNTPQMSKH